MYATLDDIEARLGRNLTSQEEASYGSMLEAVSAEIDVRLGLLDPLESVPAAIKGVTVTAAIRAAANPSGVARLTESIGALSRSETFDRSSADTTFLTATEERLIRRAVYRKTTGSPLIGSVLDDVARKETI